ncbi:hypothetical protein [Helicobacter pullorum]
MGYTQGKEKLEEMLGAMICQAKIKGEKKPLKPVSGLSTKKKKSPPPLHSIITYKYNGLTKNNLPRFPTFLHIRYKEFQ